ncbi:chaplin [Streptomyces sp. NPDC002446]
MKRFVQSAATAAAGCALVVSGAGIASAGGGVAQQGGHERAGHAQYIQQSYGGHKHRHGHHGHGGGNSAVAKGVATRSPGFLSGNVIQVPINIPINACGNSLNILALLNPAFGNHCVNGSFGGK